MYRLIDIGPEQRRILLELEDGPRVFGGTVRTSMRVLDRKGLVNTQYDQVDQKVYAKHGTDHRLVWKITASLTSRGRTFVKELKQKCAA